MSPSRHLAHAAGTFLAHSTCAPAEVRVDPLGTRVEYGAEGGRRPGGALPLPAICAAGRCHGELRRPWRRGRPALRFLRRISSARRGTTPMERRPAARSATRPEGASEDPAQLPPGKTMAARAGGHALPAPCLAAPGPPPCAPLSPFA